MSDIKDTAHEELRSIVSECMEKHAERLEKRIAPLEELVKRNDKLLRGNGSKGLNERMSRLEDLFVTLKDLLEEIKDKQVTSAEIELLITKSVDEKVEKAIDESEKNTITFKTVFKEYLQPLLIAGLLYLLIDVIPRVIAHLGS